jgi:hypothetical protein
MYAIFVPSVVGYTFAKTDVSGNIKWSISYRSSDIRDRANGT